MNLSLEAMNKFGSRLGSEKIGNDENKSDGIVGHIEDWLLPYMLST